MESFEELELILDTNLQLASSFWCPESDAADKNKTRVSEECWLEHASDNNVEQVSTVLASHARGHAAAEGYANPVPGAASMSLALGSLVSLTLVPPPSRAQKLALSSAKKVAAKPEISQKRILNPNPVVPSSKLEVSMGIAPSQSAVRKVENFISPFPDFQKLNDSLFREPTNPAGLRKATIVWFRNDLRLHDNEALLKASNDSISVLPVYCFDPRDYGKSTHGFDKTGPYRAKFLLECVANLRDNLRERGSDLIIRIGKPEEVLLGLAKAVGADGLYVHQEVAYEELNAEENVLAVLKDEGVETVFFWGSTLFHIDDLPFKLEDMPSNYGGFSEQLRGAQVRATTEAPKHLKGLPVRGSVKPGDVPTLQDLGLNPSIVTRLQEKHPSSGGSPLIGGEDEALLRLKSFASDLPCTPKSTTSKTGKATGDSLYGANFSCKISPWLAMGCLSPRRMFEDLQQHCKGKGFLHTPKSYSGDLDDPGLTSLLFELLWRDFFRFITKKFGSGKTGAPATACVGAVPV